MFCVAWSWYITWVRIREPLLLGARFAYGKPTFKLHGLHENTRSLWTSCTSSWYIVYRTTACCKLCRDWAVTGKLTARCAAPPPKPVSHGTHAHVHFRVFPYVPFFSTLAFSDNIFSFASASALENFMWNSFFLVKYIGSLSYTYYVHRLWKVWES